MCGEGTASDIEGCWEGVTEIEYEVTWVFQDGEVLEVQDLACEA